MINYEGYELHKVKQDMEFVGEFVVELNTLLDLYKKGELPNGINELKVEYQLRDVKRALINSWLILDLNEHGEHHWKLTDK